MTCAPCRTPARDVETPRRRLHRASAAVFLGALTGLAGLTGLISTTATAAATAPVLVAVAKWQIDNDRLTLAIPLTGAMTSKQKNMISGGFTTVSQLTLRDGEQSDEGQEHIAPILRIRCSVKFDAWEELYEVSRIDAPARNETVKDFAAYGDICLTAGLDQPALLARMAPSGGTLMAALVVKQTSLDEAGRIKDWLIQQQSGVMQSLFSHMLGELTLNETLLVRITVPPKPAQVPQLPQAPQVHDGERQDRRSEPKKG